MQVPPIPELRMSTKINKMILLFALCDECDTTNFKSCIATLIGIYTKLIAEYGGQDTATGDGEGLDEKTKRFWSILQTSVMENNNDWLDRYKTHVQKVLYFLPFLNINQYPINELAVKLELVDGKYFILVKNADIQLTPTKLYIEPNSTDQLFLKVPSFKNKDRFHFSYDVIDFIYVQPSPSMSFDHCLAYTTAFLIKNADDENRQKIIAKYLPQSESHDIKIDDRFFYFNNLKFYSDHVARNRYQDFSFTDFTLNHDGVPTMDEILKVRRNFDYLLEQIHLQNCTLDMYTAGLVYKLWLFWRKTIRNDSKFTTSRELMANFITAYKANLNPPNCTNFNEFFPIDDHQYVWMNDEVFYKHFGSINYSICDMVWFCYSHSVV